MKTNSKKISTPMKPYEDSLWDHFSFYDNFPYIHNKDLCDKTGVTMVSGNLIKSFRCQPGTPYELNHDITRQGK